MPVRLPRQAVWFCISLAFAAPGDPRWRYVATGDQERVVAWESDGRPHKVELWALIGDRKLRPETGELSVSFAPSGGVPRLVGGESPVELTDPGWSAFVA